MKVNRQIADAREPAARRTPRGEARRSALLEAAREVFLEQGYEGTSIEEIVRRVGGSKASLYSYFGSKEGLFWEVAYELTDEFVNQLAVPTQANPDLEQTLHTLGMRFLGGFLDPAGCRLLRTLIAESQRFPELALQYFERGPQRVRRTLGDYLRLQREAGRIDCADPDMAASQFLELVKGPPHARMMLSVPPFGPGFDPEQHVAGAVRLFLYGCARRSP
ncbi:TetR/AcrR family transcriptional regulator [Nevskia soli]|uniref:TetR/AcrR family transcriptional regulator n=1 Tax=Nevskia soli TaxID=418856 RepID=UPI0006912728|nr:TetR/AcrR family transcriptional regulator [Nevskia soli]